MWWKPLSTPSSGAPAATTPTWCGRWWCSATLWWAWAIPKAHFGAYDRALHIARVNNGLHHPSQVLVVYRQAALLAQGGEYAEANRRHEYAYGVLLRSYGGDSTELLPGLFVLADWYMTGYNIFSARAPLRTCCEGGGCQIGRRPPSPHPGSAQRCIHLPQRALSTVLYAPFEPVFLAGFLYGFPVPPGVRPLGKQLRERRASAHQGHQHHPSPRRGARRPGSGGQENGPEEWPE